MLADEMSDSVSMRLRASIENEEAEQTSGVMDNAVAGEHTGLPSALEHEAEEDPAGGSSAGGAKTEGEAVADAVGEYWGTLH